ncbi:MAG: VIT1/CCC1 transporter family protein [Candidatus Aenigmarchaeota archaeon]|nr:VIT1/CCC1 transporter family protein [Candidatus Aenigmarchaeota archaeon]
MASKKKTYHHEEKHSSIDTGGNFRDFILGFQDGLVNVLGIVLAVAVASQDFRIILIAGIAAAMAESISMAAVAYTSTKSEKDFYRSELEREQWEIENVPHLEVKEIRDIYYKKGFRDKVLNAIVKRVTSDKKLWLHTMMKEELGLSDDDKSPVKSAAIVGISAIAGSFIPLLAFIFLPISTAIFGTIIVSIIVLFMVGTVKARLIDASILKHGLEIALIGTLSALIGYGIGALLGVVV